jgi:hypothetical protein
MEYLLDPKYLEPVQAGAKTFLKPTLPGHSSLYFYKNFRLLRSSILKSWGDKIRTYCLENDIDIYYFNYGYIKITVYPITVLEKFEQEHGLNVHNPFL